MTDAERATKKCADCDEQIATLQPTGRWCCGCENRAIDEGDVEAVASLLAYMRRRVSERRRGSPRDPSDVDHGRVVVANALRRLVEGWI